MTQNRRPGFRLPWTSEEESARQSMPATDSTADAATPDAIAPAEANGALPADAAQETAAASAADAAVAESAPATDTQDAPEAGQGAGSEAGSEAPAVAATAASADPEPEFAAPAATAAADASETDFMRDLVAAMRGVADEARRSTTADVQARAEAQVRQLEDDSERRRAELHATADADVAGVGQWAQAEAERIRVEAEQRVAARRAQLEEQLAAESHRGEAETRAIRDRLAEYERELDAYHAQLTEISDPAAFAAAAKRMPPPPSFEAIAAAVASASAAPAAAVQTAPAPAAPEPEPEHAAAAQPAAEAEPASEAEPEAAAEPETESQSEPTTDQAAEAPGAIPAAMAELLPAGQNGAEPATDDAPAPENGTLAQRLAHLRAEAAAGSETPTSPEAAAGESVTTEVVVRGLGSFGAITGFRQALSNVDGIDAVSLSLGQSGEFVFRATHAPGFDVSAAIVTLEGDSARVEPTPAGGLHVTLERAR